MAFCGPVDDFTSGSFAAHWTGGYGTSSVSGGRAVISSGSDYAAKSTATGYSLTGNEMLVEVDSNGSTSGETYFMFRTDSGADIGFGRQGSNLVAISDLGNTTIGTYNQTTHRWLRMHESGGTLYWSTSPDGTTWTNRHSAASSGYTLGSGYLEIGAGNSVTYYDNLNNPPASGTTVNPAVVVGTGTVGAPTASSSRTATTSAVVATAGFGSPTPTASATAAPAAVAGPGTVESPNVQAGSNINASATVIGRSGTVGAPSISASASPVPTAVSVMAFAVLPDAANSTGNITAGAHTIRTRATVPEPGVDGVVPPMAFPGRLKHWDGSAWQEGRLNHRGADGWQPGQLNASITPTRLQSTLYGDRYLAHEGLLEGVPEWYDWGLVPRIGYGNCVGPRNEWTGAVAWGEIYPEAGWTPTRNTICVVRSMGMAVLSATTGLWTVMQEAEGAAEFYGAYFQYDFSGNATGPEPLLETGDGYVAGVPGFGFNMHFFPYDRAEIADPGDVAGVVAWFDARLEVAEDATADDRATSRFLCGAGGDWWLSPTAPYAEGNANNGDWSIGRHRFLNDSWQTFTAHTLNVHQIRSNPPPITLA